jgi:hypothetical protein
MSCEALMNIGFRLFAAIFFSFLKKYFHYYPGYAEQRSFIGLLLWGRLKRMVREKKEKI